MRTFRRLLGLIAPFRGWVALAVLLSFGTTGASVGLMAVSAYLISKAAITTQVTDLSLAIAGVRLFAISRATLRYAERVISHRTTFRILTRLRVWFYQAIEPLAPARLMSYRSADLLARIMADIETLENFYVRVIVPPLTAALVTALACAILGYFDGRLAVALLFFMVLTGLLLPALSYWLSQQPAGASIVARAELNTLFLDEIQGMADLLALGQEMPFVTRIHRKNSELAQLQQQLALVRGMGNGLAALFTTLAGLTILGLAIPLVSQGEIEGVYLALLPLTAIAAFEAVQPLSQAFQVLEANQAAGQRLFDLIDAPPEVSDPPEVSPAPEEYAIDFRQVDFRYNSGEPPALSDLSLAIPSGGRIAILGPSGSGKSSIVNLLLRFWDYQAGQITLGGHDIRNYQADDLRALVAVVSQDAHLFNTTIRDNLLMADPDARDEKLEKVCRQAQLHDFIQALPGGYDTLVGENGLALSGGERQRLAIAQALLKDAPVLILDEATTHLDAVTENRVIAALNDFAAGRTTLIIGHRLSTAWEVDRLLRLDRGQILAPDAWFHSGDGREIPAPTADGTVPPA